VNTADALARRVAEALFSREGIGGELGIDILEVRAGYARVALTLSARMLNGHGSAHGGLIFTLADTAFAYACNSHNVASVAQQASIAFLSPALLGERLTAEAVERAVEGRSGVCEVVVTGPDGRTVAIFQGLSRSLGRAVVISDGGAPHG
jgi:acyl-CoA thioesterase